MEDRPELILHIGRHKCGTSSLQRFLSANDETLAAHGFHYPRAQRQPYAHHPVAHYYAGTGALPEQDVQEFWSALAAHPRSVVSSEAFQNIDPHRLAPHLSAFRVTLVAYFREPLDYLHSSYAQKVKAGNTDATLEDYAAHFYVPYHDFMRAWQEALPHAALKVRLFERQHLARADVRADFLILAGMPEAAMATFPFPDEDGNPSIGGSLLEYVRQLVPRRADFGEDWWELYAAVQELALSDPAYRVRPAMPMRLQEEIRARHFDQVERFERDFLPPDCKFSCRLFPEGRFITDVADDEARAIARQLCSIRPGLVHYLHDGAV